MKSLCLVLTNKKTFSRSQISHLKKFHLANCTQLGAFHDEHGLVEKYAKFIKRRNCQIDVPSVLSTLTNGADKEFPSLRIESRAADDETILCVGDITRRPNESNAISVDCEEFALFTVSLLRRLKQRASLGFRLSLSDGSFVPSIIHIGKERYSISSIPSGDSESPCFIEILSDEAVIAFLKFSRAYSMAQALDMDTYNRAPYVWNEFNLRGMSIGHELYLAQNVWSMDDVTSDKMTSKKVNEIEGVFDFRSIRSEIEKEVVLPLQTWFAELLENMALGSLESGCVDDYRVILHDQQYFNYFKNRYLERTDDIQAAKLLIAKLDAAAGLFFHYHDADQCCELSKGKN